MERSFQRWIAVIASCAACHSPEAPPRIEVAPGIVGVRAGESLAYILVGDGSAALIDAGSDAQGAAILAELERQQVSPSQVETILLTHGHRDHVAAAGLFAQATVWVSDADHRLIRGDRRNEGMLPKLTAHLGPAPPLNQGLRSLLPRTLQTVAGHEVDVFPIPGHTAGSLAFLSAGVLFSGDSLILAGDEVEGAPLLTSGDRERNHRALRRLEKVPFTTIADGHHGVAPDGRARFERWLER